MDPDVQGLNDVLLGPLLGSAAGILTIGFAAALGEETLFRGALQPRFGIFLTTLLFAITHNQYGLSLSTVVVFAAGLIFAGLRRRHNTVTSMLAHATYNITLGLLALLAMRLLENTQI
ncbi:MAG: CPBP family intramembrane metalloprotease [Burkholderiaceae bacterium]|nr:CPBP family intramembrane metalloprotease [Burkholderiaceae bacterium]